MDFESEEDWDSYPQINEDPEDDRLTAYIFGAPVKIFEEEDGDLREELKFREEKNHPMVCAYKFLMALFFRQEAIC